MEASSPAALPVPITLLWGNIFRFAGWSHDRVVNRLMEFQLLAGCAFLDRNGGWAPHQSCERELVDFWERTILPDICRGREADAVRRTILALMALILQNITDLSPTPLHAAPARFPSGLGRRTYDQ